MAFVTPLRYPGGKGRLGAWLADLMRANNLEGGTYVEPYAGGAGAAMHLLVEGVAKRVIINDIDPAIYAFWWAVFNRTEELCERVRNAKITLAERERQKKVLRSTAPVESLDRGYAAFFLNRTSRSGILKGGPIGGRSQNGKYKLDARFNQAQLAERIERLGSLRSQVKVCQVDAMKLVREVTRRPRKKLLIYCDPPYFKKGYQLYKNHYAEGDHEDIATRMTQLNVPWLVTYDDCRQIKKLYADAESTKFRLHYSTHLTRTKAAEQMFYGNLELTPKPYLFR